MENKHYFQTGGGQDDGCIGSLFPSALSIGVRPSDFKGPLQPGSSQPSLPYVPWVKEHTRNNPEF